MAVILVPCILVTVSDSSEEVLSFSLYAQAAAFAVLLFLDGTKSHFGRKAAQQESSSGRGTIMFLGAAVTILMWAAVLYMMR